MKFYFFLFIIFLVSCKNANELTTEVVSEVVVDTLQSKVLNKKVPIRIYQPKKQDKSISLPLVYLLHGHGGSDDDWFTPEEGNVQHLLDSLIAANKIPKLIAVTINAENSWYVNSQENMETFYITEFIPTIESRLYSNSSVTRRYIAGNSAGGYGALNFSLKYPNLFDAAMLLSPAAYYPTPPAISSSRKIDVFSKNGQFNDSIWQSYSYTKIVNDENTNSYPKFYISTGDDDAYQIFEVVAQLRAFFQTKNIEVETTVINGGHTWDVWRKQFVNDIIRIFNE